MWANMRIYISNILDKNLRKPNLEHQKSASGTFTQTIDESCDLWLQAFYIKKIPKTKTNDSFRCFSSTQSPNFKKFSSNNHTGGINEVFTCIQHRSSVR